MAKDNIRPIKKPQEPCPCCGSKLLIVHDDGMRSGDSWSVICKDCGCKGYEHCTKPLAILCWESGASQMREIVETANTLGWTGPLPEPSFDPPHIPASFVRPTPSTGESNNG